MKVFNLLIFVASLVRGSWSQYPPVYLSPYFNDQPYYQPQPQYQLQQPFVNDVVAPDPLMNFVRVLNTDYGEWPPKKPDNQTTNQTENEEPQTLKPNLQFPPYDQKVKLTNPEPPSLTPVLSFPFGSTQQPIPTEFQKLNDVMNRMKTEMERLNKETKCIHAGNLGELNQLQKLRTDLKIALESTKHLKNDLLTHEKQIMEISEGMKARSRIPVYDQELAKEFTKMVEHLEKLVERLTHKRLVQKYKKPPRHP